MSLLLPVIALVFTAGLAIAALLFLRRGAPDGSYIKDSDRASGIFGVLATGFAFVLGFIIFLAFSSYDASRAGAEVEALKVAQMFQAAQFMGDEPSAELGGELICYGRYVVGQEWPAMEDDTLEDNLNPWGLEMFRTLQTVQPEGAVEETAYAKWIDLSSEREEARQDRIHGAEGVIPVTLWVLLLLGALMVLTYMMFFADSGERAIVQAMQIGTVVVLMGATMILIQRLNDPFGEGPGGLEPTAMERTLGLLEVQLADEVDTGPLPCAENGELVEG